MQSFKTFGKLLLVLALTSGLAACGGGGGTAATGAGASTTITGSAGDGPVTNGNVSVKDANGNPVTTTPANPTTGTNAQFSFTVPSGTALPLTITVTGGTDTVTGNPQDFPLRTAVTTLPASGTVTGNANPLSTLAVASAEAQAGGITAASLTAATNNILGAVGFGLGAGINPLSTTVTNTNAASIVRANEAAAELIRRASNASGGTLANTITSIAQDLTDGVIDGQTATLAAGTTNLATATTASHLLNQQAQISAETLANNLTVTAPNGRTLVSGATSATTLNTAITTTGHTGNTSAVLPSQAFLDQTRAAINIANTLTGGGSALLNNLLGGINTLTAGTVPSTAQQTSLTTLAGAATFPTPANITANAVAAAAAATAVAADVTAPVAPTLAVPAAGLTNINTPTVSGTAEAGAVVTVLNGSTSVGTAIAVGGAWTLTSAVLADGAHTLTAVATDAAGNTGPASTGVTITVDTVAPTVAITTTAASPTNAAFTTTLTFSKSVTGVTLADFAVTNGAAGTFAAVSGTVYTALITPTATGAVTVDVAANAANDAAGNGSTVAPQLSVTFDNVAPTVAITTTAASPTNTAFTATLTFSEAVTGVTLADFVVTNGAASAFNAVSGTVYTALITPTAPGAVTVNVAANAASDTAGNGSTVATQLSVFFDNVAPTVAITTTATSPTNTAFTATLTFSETVTGVTLADFAVTNGAAGTFNAVSGSIYTALITPTAPGAVTVNVAANAASDAAGNGSTVATQLSVTFDNVAPTAPTISTPTTGSFVNSTASVAISGVAGSAEAGATITVKDGAATLGTATAAADGSWTFASGVLTATAHSFTANQTDLAGNAGPASTAVVYTVDTVAPAAPTISTPTTGSFVNSTASVAISGVAGSAEAGATITVKDGATTLGTATAAADGSWTFASGVLTEAVHSFTATQTDIAGNTGAASTAVVYTVDTTAPVAPTITTPANGSYTSTTTPVVTGSAEASATVKVFDTDGTTLLGTTTAAGSGLWSLSTSALATGAHTLTTKQTDLAGNTGLASTGTSITINNIPRFAYVQNGASNTISMYTVDSVTGQLSHNGFISTGTGISGLTVDPSGKFAYATNTPGRTVAAYTINQTTGRLAIVGTPIAAGTNPNKLVVDPAGRFVYVANAAASGTILTYSINQTTGALTAVGAGIPAGTNPNQIVVDPTGQFAYAVNTFGNTISTYSINQASGALTAAGTVTTGSLSRPRSIGMDPLGRFVYVANETGNSVSGYTINPTTGVLTFMGATVATGTTPTSVTVDPSGKFVYVANRSTNNVSAYRIDQITGVLTSVGAATAGTDTITVNVNPSGKFAYATNRVSNEVKVFTINLATGALTLASTVATQLDARDIVFVGGTSPAIDTTAPGQPAISSPAGAAVNTNTPTVSGTSEPGATIKLYSGTVTLTLVGTTTADAFGNWTLTSGALVNGAHTLTVTATDAAGNVSVVSAGVTVTVNGNPTITGAAVDGYVSGAALTVYSDLALTTQIGTGTTDAGGQFSIQLTAATVPDPMYIRSVGGTNIDTGMPAPTMMFTVSGSPTTGLNITPMTNAVYGRVQDGQSLNAAQVGLLTDLGLASNAELYGNPVVTASLQANMFKALTSGTMGATLAAGNYQMFVMTAGEDQLAGGGGQITGVTSINTLIDPAKGLFVGPVNFNVAANGNVSGTYTAGATTMNITGKVQGSSIVFNIINPNANPALPPISITRVVGTIGLNASVSGNFTDISGLDQAPTPPVMTKGVFVGSFIPATGVNATGLATFVNNFYSPGASGGAPSGTGLMNIVARDILLAPGSTVPKISWGQAAVTAVDVAAGTVTMTNMPMNQDAGSIVGTAPLAPPFTATFSAGQYVKSGATPTNILIFEYTIPSGEKLYIVTAVGLRRGIYMIVPTAGAASGKIGVIGESYMSKASGLVPGLTAGTTYDVTVASINAGMPGQSRTQALGIGTAFAQPESVGPMPIPAAPFNAQNGSIDTTNGAPELMVFQGSVMAMKQDTNNNFADNQFIGGTTDDHIRVVEFFESGAMMGEEINGGTFDPDGAGPLPPITLRDFPSTFVGFFHPNGAASPSFTGSLNILARTTYSNDFSLFLDAYVTGTLDITLAPTTAVAGAATLNVVDPNGTTITGNLTIDAIGTKYGVYHIHGADSGGSYTDIFWPIGSKKATYIVSTGVAGNVSEVGEAYITQ